MKDKDREFPALLRDSDAAGIAESDLLVDTLEEEGP
jgi:hypothetical protein